MSQVGSINLAEKESNDIRKSDSLAEESTEQSAESEEKIPCLCRHMTKSAGHACGIAFASLIIPMTLLAMLLMNFPPLSRKGAADPFDWRSINRDTGFMSEEVALANLFSMMGEGETEKHSTANKSQQNPGPFFSVIYHAMGPNGKGEGDLLNQKMIERIRKAESLFLKDTDFHKFCLKKESLSGNITCAHFPVSPTNYFYSNTKPCCSTRTDFSGKVCSIESNCCTSLECPFRIDACKNGTSECPLLDGRNNTIRNIEIVKQDLILNSKRGVRGIVTSKFSKENPTSAYSQAWMQFGFPLEGFQDEEDKKDKQHDIFNKWALKIDHELQDMNKEFDDFEMIWFGSFLFEGLLNELLMHDVLLAVGSMIFVVFWIMFHTQSVFLALAGMLHILMALPLAGGILPVFGIKEITPLSFLGIYIILAIGADDIFVFVDHFKHVKYDDSFSDNSFSFKLYHAWKQAFIAMSITSFTTMVAFFANAFSVLPGIAGFGAFAGMLIFFNFIFVVTYFPAVVVINHFIFSKLHFCLCCTCIYKGETEDCSCCSNEEKQDDEGNSGKSPSQSDEIVPDLSKGKSQLYNKNSGSPLEKCMKGSYFPWWSSTNECYPYISLASIFTFVVLFLSLGVTGIVGLRPSTEPDQVFPEDHYLQRFITIMSGDTFQESFDDNQIEVRMIFGVELNKEGYNKHSDVPGVLEYKDSFDLADPKAQEHIREVCKLASDDRGTPQLVRNGEVLCFLDDFAEWLQKRETWPILVIALEEGPNDLFDLNTFSDPRVTELQTFPIQDKKVFNLLLYYWFQQTLSEGNRDYFGLIDFTKIPTASTTISFFEKYLETKICMENCSQNCHSDCETHLIAQKLSALRTSNSKVTDTMRVRMVQLKANSTLKSGWWPSARVNPHVYAWQAFAEKENQRASAAGLKKADFLVASWTNDQWQYAHTQDIYVQNAINGILISYCLAVVILMIATGNILLTIFAGFNIFGCLACVLGCIPLLGWKLGTIESISLTIVIGLSVDYVVHLAHSYRGSKSLKRNDRVYDMVAEMGSTVIGGAVTSIGASLFLFGCMLQFFGKFGIFICLTCLFAILWSLFFFVPILSVLGPEGNYGQLWFKKEIEQKDVQGEIQSM